MVEHNLLIYDKLRQNIVKVSIKKLTPIWSNAVNKLYEEKDA